jgi:asparagine synthase (glutamine-hydrolysing)
MLRYLALSWDERSDQARKASALLRARLESPQNHWNSVVNRPGFSVFCKGDRPVDSQAFIGAKSSGVVLGVLMTRPSQLSDDGVGHRVTLTPQQATDMTLSEGSSLIKSHWGCYVAITHDEVKVRTAVVRGPMSDLACLYTAYKGVHVLFSRMEDCIGLRLLPLSINWDYIVAHSVYVDVRGRETGIREVVALEGGERLTLSSEKSVREFLWNPCEISKIDRIEDPTIAAAGIRSTAKYCINSWASVHGNSLLRLSGGLDSSILLSALRAAPSDPQVTCINTYSEGERGDERSFARLAARASKAEVLERERDPHLDLRVIEGLARTADPMRDYNGCENHKKDMRLAGDKGATAIFEGSVGDQIFDNHVGGWAVSEYIWAHGLRPGSLRIAREVALCWGLSIPRLLRDGIFNGLLNPPSGPWTYFLAGKLNMYGNASGANASEPHGRLVPVDVQENARHNLQRFLHPWLWNVDGTPPGKLWVIATMTAEMRYNSVFSDVSDPAVLVAPFGSQPLVELCLRIASYLSMQHGYCRAVARRAFSQDLPPEILWRSSKGTCNSWIQQLLKYNMQFVKEFLLDGKLVKERILDRPSVEHTLSISSSGSRRRELDIMRHLYTEAWLRRWSEGGYKAAA